MRPRGYASSGRQVSELSPPPPGPGAGVAQTLFDYPSLAAVRRHDPRTSKLAAASDRAAKAEQWKAILKRLVEGPISADTAGRVINRHRSIASSRIGVMMDRGLVQRAGIHLEAGDDGRERPVLRYELTDAGRREVALMLGAQ